MAKGLWLHLQAHCVRYYVCVYADMHPEKARRLVREIELTWVNLYEYGLKSPCQVTGAKPSPFPSSPTSHTQPVPLARLLGVCRLVTPSYQGSLSKCKSALPSLNMALLPYHTVAGRIAPCLAKIKHLSTPSPRDSNARSPYRAERLRLRHSAVWGR